MRYEMLQINCLRNTFLGETQGREKLFLDGDQNV